MNIIFKIIINIYINLKFIYFILNRINKIKKNKKDLNNIQKI